MKNTKGNLDLATWDWNVRLPNQALIKNPHGDLDLSTWDWNVSPLHEALITNPQEIWT